MQPQVVPPSIGVATAGAERSADAEDGGPTWPDGIFGTHRIANGPKTLCSGTGFGSL